MAIELAKAYVQIVPKAEGLGNSIRAQLESAGDEAGAAGGAKAGGAFSNALGSAAKITGAAVTAAATAVGSIVSNSVQQFAEYEQLAGGAELMFGSAYDAVAERAANAYATVQMSQNEYLQQVNGFATGLKTSLGGNEQAAADLADRIITAEADVVAATGASQESIQNAFNGIMKSNFTMLDNLQLGINPTKEGFQEVIDKVNEWNAANGEATDYQMGNLADMQSALVDYIDMVGVAGYAQAEASGTIEGSLASTKAAWSNLLVGLADDNANFEQLVGNLVDTIVGPDGASGLVGNLIPRIQMAMEGIAQVIEGVAPMIVAVLPGLVESILPGLLSSALSIVDAIVAALPGLLQAVIAALLSFLPQIVQTGLDLFLGLIGALPEIISTIVAALPQIITSITNTLLNNIPAIVTAGVQLLVALVQNLPAIITGVVAAIPQIISGLVSAVINGAPQLARAGLQLMQGLVQGIRNSVTALWNAMTSAVGGIIDGAKRLLGIHSPSRVFAEIGAYTMEGFADGILKNEALVADAMEDASALASGSFNSTLTVNTALAGRAAPAASSGQQDVAQAVAQALRNVRVYINGNQLVGYLVPDIDAALGMRRLQAERGSL